MKILKMITGVMLTVIMCISAAVISTAAESGYKRGDVDGDGLDITDATKIQRYLAEFDDPYHIGELVSNNTQPTQDEYELPFVPN